MIYVLDRHFIKQVALEMIDLFQQNSESNNAMGIRHDILLCSSWIKLVLGQEEAQQKNKKFQSLFKASLLGLW